MQKSSLIFLSCPKDVLLTECNINIQNINEYSGFQFESFICVDGRNASQAKELIRQANIVILGGGNAAAQNEFFREIGLRDLLKDYDGIIWGISAGSMNCAEFVYARPRKTVMHSTPSMKDF